MLKVTSRTLLASAALVALAACSDSAMPTAPESAPVLDPHGPVAGLTATPSFDNTLLASTDAPDAVNYQDAATVKLSLASTIAGTGGLDIVTLMDASGSLGTTGWTQEKEFVSDLIGNVIPPLPSDGRTRMGIIEFSNQVAVRYPLYGSQDPVAMQSVVQGLPFFNSYTWTKSAVVAGINQFDYYGDPDHGKLMLLITDGTPVPSPAENPCIGINLGDQLRLRGIKTIILAVGNFNVGQISCLVEDASTDVISVAGASELYTVLDQISTYVNPQIADVHLTGTLSSDFDLEDGPNKAETLTINGSDDSSVAYDSGTRTVTWDLPLLDRRTRNVTVDLKRSLTADPVCGSGVTAVSNLHATYTDGNGATQTVDLPDVTMDVTGCPAPVITPTVTGDMGDNGWYVGDVSVSWDVQSVEALTDQTGCGDVTISSDTGGTDITCSATSAVGTSSNTVTVKRDATPPVVAFSGNAPVYVYGEQIQITCDASDATSGIATSDCPSVDAPADSYPEGTVTLDASATDNAGHTTTAQITFEVVVDNTPPTVTYSGNQGTYGASETVHITCSASDNQTGVASDTCQDIDGVAWTFGLGEHTYTATAVDGAGNEGSGSTTFTVTVSVDDMQALLDAWVTGPGASGVKNSLMAKLKGKKANVNAFINEVRAQSGKKIDADQAEILIQLAQGL